MEDSAPASRASNWSGCTISQKRMNDLDRGRLRERENEMREIKFKAWDGHKIWIVETWEELHDPDLQVMQFTGLHDKNWKEIWEGDICKCFDMIGKVEWDGPHATLNCGYWSQFMLNSQEYEVIGNIYENPELLERGVM